MPQLKSKLSGKLKAFLRDDRAATAIEYGLIAVATSIVVAAAMDTLRESSLWDVFEVISDRISELTSQ
jgi:Flp pilus assembly pilin Flp